jgi:periplasmic divalent cation tolerance protein
MTSARAQAVVLVTAPDLKTARRLAQGAVRARLAACVSLVPRVESHYWWQGRMEQSAEVLLVIKTTRRRLPALEKQILTHHPYDTPEFLVLSPAAGTKRYLRWLSASVTAAVQ